MDRRRMHDVIEQLIEAGEIVDGVVKSGNGKQFKRLWSDKNAPLKVDVAA
jgi:hypothetical protein